MKILESARSRIVVLLGTVLTCAAVLAGGGSASAVATFGASTNVLPSIGSCTAVGHSDSAVAADGTVRGFADSGTCPGAMNLILFTVTSADRVTNVVSPYSGNVMDVAWDGRDVLYVLFVDAGYVRIASYVVSRGVFSPVTTLGYGFATDGVNTGALTASVGRWWAVWVGPTPFSAFETMRGQLYQAHTLYGRRAPSAITHPDQWVTDNDPSLTNGGGHVTLAWTRYPDWYGSRPLSVQSSVIQLATSTGGAWTSRTFTAGGTRNYNSAVFSYAGHTGVAFMREDAGVIVATDVGTAQFATRLLAGASAHYASYPLSLAASGTSLFATWNVNQSQIEVAERRDGVWTQSEPVPDGQYPTRIMGQGGRALLLYDRYELTRQQ